MNTANQPMRFGNRVVQMIADGTLLVSYVYKSSMANPPTAPRRHCKNARKRTLFKGHRP